MCIEPPFQKSEDPARAALKAEQLLVEKRRAEERATQATAKYVSRVTLVFTVDRKLKNSQIFGNTTSLSLSLFCVSGVLRG